MRCHILGKIKKQKGNGWNLWDRTGIREFHKSYSLETKPFSLMSVVKMTFGDGTLSR